MGFSSIDDLLNKITVNKQILTVQFTKVAVTGATSAAGRFHECLSAAGTGGTMVLTGTAGVGIPMNSSKSGAIPIGQNVEPSMTKHLLSMMAVTPGATVPPGVLILTDIIHIYPSCVVVTTPTTLSNHPTWTGTGDTRMTDAKGVQASVLLTTASSAAGQLTLNYTDQDNNAQVQTGSLYSPVATHPAGALFGQTVASATLGGPNMAPAVGDYGVKQVNSYAINANATAGTACIVLHRPVCTIPLALVNMPSERDFLTGPVRLPRIYDDACLGFFLMVGGALTTGQIVNGELVLGWG